MSNIKEAIRNESRTGNSLKAKFFRWKDRVQKGRSSIKDMFPDYSIEKAGEYFAPDALGDTCRAMDALRDDPDNPDLYAAARSQFLKLAARMKELGGDVDLDAPEE